MDFFSLIEELSPEYGPAGFEDRVRDLLWQKLTPLCDETWTDTMGNLIGVKRSVQPDAKKLLLDAHMDEVGLIVTGIENGFLRFGNLGGIDAQVLPATTVTVLTQDGPLPGVIDTMPPHALSTEDMDKAVPMDALVIDVGMTRRRQRLPSHWGHLWLSAPGRSVWQGSGSPENLWMTGPAPPCCCWCWKN